MDWRTHWQMIRQLASLPGAHLRFDRALAPEHVSETYRNYTRRHPKYKLIQHKRWGAALLDLHRYPSPEAYLAQLPGRNGGAAHARKARTRGYVVQEIDRNAHADAIHAINTSLSERQGRPMDACYTQRIVVFDKLPHFRHLGVLDREGKLVAYADLALFGNFYGFSRLIGYRNNDGIMHLLVADIVAELLAQKRARYLMYDTYFGAQPGLKQFKTMLGFAPYRVRYTIQ